MTISVEVIIAVLLGFSFWGLGYYMGINHNIDNRETIGYKLGYEQATADFKEQLTEKPSLIGFGVPSESDLEEDE